MGLALLLIILAVYNWPSHRSGARRVWGRGANTKVGAVLKGL